MTLTLELVSDDLVFAAVAAAFVVVVFVGCSRTCGSALARFLARLMKSWRGLGGEDCCWNCSHQLNPIDPERWRRAQIWLGYHFL